MEFKGTKGKWGIMDASRFAVPFIVYNDNNETIFQCYGKEANANALLISKAPEMLEMLKEIHSFLSSGTRINSDDIEQLIKEATEI